MSLAASQQKVFLRLVAALRPHWRRDPGLPARIQALFAANRSFGSRDRRLYRELLYTTLRFLPWIEPLLDSDPDRAVQTVAWLSSDSPAVEAFRAAQTRGWPPCPPELAARAAHLGRTPAELVPGWFSRHGPAAVSPDNLDALHRRAPLWLRVQGGDVEAVLAEFQELGWAVDRSPVLPEALRLDPGIDVKKSRAWQQGRVEVQDLGSQMVLEAAGASPGQRWLDACAGAGGKSLQLAFLLGPAGRVDAHDVRPEALRELEFRATRAGFLAAEGVLSNGAAAAIRILRSPPAGEYDGVLVDAPCSGSGTWRRSPHLKWTTSAGTVAQAAEKQGRLLAEFAARVRPGGRLVYATCSLSRMENEDVVAGFLAAQAGFETAPLARTFGFEPADGTLTILPARHDTDGFFVAVLHRKGN